MGFAWRNPNDRSDRSRKDQSLSFISLSCPPPVATTLLFPG